LSLTADEGGQRLDRYLADRLDSLSRSRVQALIREGQVRVDGQVQKPSYRLTGGEVLEVHIPPPREVSLEPEAIPLDIVYEDGDILVVDKPAGMVVHPAVGHQEGTLVNALLGYLPELASIGGELRPGIVHRLDKDTSGLVVVARNDSSHRDLQRQFQERQVEKVYLALVEGAPEEPRGAIIAPIGRDPAHRKRMAVVQGGREAETHYTVQRCFPHHSLLEVRPRTGRTHQVRVHLAYIGHPVAGDRVYGRRKPSLPLERQFLHARRLAFRLPEDGQRKEFSAPLPAELVQVLELLERQS
jgi:23S rRNA pseudouridine1911/1915/1917 synthase